MHLLLLADYFENIQRGKEQKFTGVPVKDLSTHVLFSTHNNMPETDLDLERLNFARRKFKNNKSSGPGWSSKEIVVMGERRGQITNACIFTVC